MYHIAEIVKKENFFQKAYEIKDGCVFITDTKRAKKKFLKSGIERILFYEEALTDALLGKLVKKAQITDRDFEKMFLEEMIKETVGFLKLSPPFDNVAVFSEFGEEFVPFFINYAKVITLVGEEGERGVIKGVNIRRVKKLKELPDFIIEDSKRGLSPIFNVPGVHIGEGKCESKRVLSPETISFKAAIAPCEISLRTLRFLLEKEGDFEYELTSFRKKCPSLLTFG